MQLRNKYDNIKYRKSTISNKGGIDYLIVKIREGYTQDDIAGILHMTNSNLSQYVTRRGYTWNDLKHIANNPRYEYETQLRSVFKDEESVTKLNSIFDAAGGEEFLIDCKHRKMTMQDICDELFDDYFPQNSKYSKHKVTVGALVKYLERNNLVWADLGKGVRYEKGVIDSRGGLNYIKQLKNTHKTLNNASKASKLPVSTISMYCNRNGTKWSEL